MGYDYVESKGGYSGFVGAYMIAFAFFSMIWALLDPSTNTDSWLVLMVQFVGGLTLSIAFGFRLTKRVPLDQEIVAVGLGLIAGILTSAMSTILLMFGIPYSTNEGIWLIMLAPVAEVLALNIFPYHIIDFHFPESPFWMKAAPSNVAFAFYHYFAQGDNPIFLLLIVILMIGNTAIMWVYDQTRNATAPFTAHYIVNLAVVWETVVMALVDLIPIFVVIFVVVVALYLVFGKWLKE